MDGSHCKKAEAAFVFSLKNIDREHLKHSQCLDFRSIVWNKRGEHNHLVSHK